MKEHQLFPHVLGMYELAFVFQYQTIEQSPCEFLLRDIVLQVYSMPRMLPCHHFGYNRVAWLPQNLKHPKCTLIETMPLQDYWCRSSPQDSGKNHLSAVEHQGPCKVSWLSCVSSSVVE